MIKRKGWRRELWRRLDPERKAAPFAITVGDGWKTLICDLVDRLEAMKVPFEILQVKEKFGTLRFYVQTEEQAPEAFRRTIHKAENQSARICEDCGGKGKLRGDGWVRTLCIPCNEKFLKKRARRFRHLGRT